MYLLSRTRVPVLMYQNMSAFVSFNEDNEDRKIVLPVLVSESLHVLLVVGGFSSPTLGLVVRVSAAVQMLKHKKS